MDFEWEGEAYAIGCSKNVDTNSSNFGWNTDGNIRSITYDYTIDYACTITMPENFDGVVLSIKRASTEVSFEGKDGEAVEDKEEHFLDEHEADYFLFYRLSDMINN